VTTREPSDSRTRDSKVELGLVREHLFFERLALPGALAPKLDFAALALDRGNQSRQPSLDQEVAGARLERLHGGLFADRSGHDDERKVVARRAKQHQGLGGGEFRQAVIGDDDVPGAGLERRPHGVGSFHAGRGDFVATALELVD
jgi:hypothetical protein